MKVIVERVLFFNTIKLTTDKRDRRKWLYDTSFIRMEANADRLKLTGRTVEADIPAAVFVPGVSFIRARSFYKAVQLAPKDKELHLDVKLDGIHIGDVTMPWEAGDALLYVDPAKAPARHPDADKAEAGEAGPKPVQPRLFPHKPEA